MGRAWHPPQSLWWGGGQWAPGVPRHRESPTHSGKGLQATRGPRDSVGLAWPWRGQLSAGSVRRHAAARPRVGKEAFLQASLQPAPWLAEPPFSRQEMPLLLKGHHDSQPGCGEGAPPTPAPAQEPKPCLPSCSLRRPPGPLSRSSWCSEEEELQRRFDRRGPTCLNVCPPASDPGPGNAHPAVSGGCGDPGYKCGGRNTPSLPLSSVVGVSWADLVPGPPPGGPGAGAWPLPAPEPPHSLPPFSNFSSNVMPPSSCDRRGSL